MMHYKGLNTYECTDDECGIITIKVDKYGHAHRIKRDSRGVRVG